MSFRVIGLSGPAGCGKDTAAHHLKNHFGFAVHAFATPLKAGLCAMFGWAPELLDNREWKERPLPSIGKSPRQLMQTLGTEWGRQLVHPELWLLLARERCFEARSRGLPGVVFTDCRFVNEAEFVKGATGTVIRIERDACTPVAGHVSETPIPGHLVDVIVRNNDSLEKFYSALRAVIELTPGLSVPSGTGVHFTGHGMLDEPVAQMPDETLQRCGHMSRTKRVCVEAAGHRLRHNDGVALWDSHE